MATRNATKPAKAATAEKPQAKPVDAPKAPTTPPADEQAANQTPPPGETGNSAPSDKTADYVHADGFTLNEDGDVVDAAGLALPPVLEGEGGSAMVLLSLAKACMPAFEHSAAFDAAAEKTRMLAESLDNIEIQAALEQAFNELTPAVRDVLIERERQVVAKGYTPERDDAHSSYELPRAAAGYVMNASGIPSHRALMYWPFDPSAFKPKGYRADLVKAAALLLAEIERIDRAEAAE